MSADEKDPRPPAPPEAESRPAAPVHPSAAPSVPDATPCGRELERLAVPERSLFEDAADVTPEALRGVHRANPLSVLVEAVKLASGLVTLLVLARMGRILSGDAAAIFQVLAAAAIIFVACLTLSLAVWRARTWELAEREVVLHWGPGGAGRVAGAAAVGSGRAAPGGAARGACGGRAALLPGGPLRKHRSLPGACFRWAHAGGRHCATRVHPAPPGVREPLPASGSPGHRVGAHRGERDRRPQPA